MKNLFLFGSILLTESEKRIIFYGEKNSSPYFNGNVYILKNNVGGVSIHPEIIQGDDIIRDAGNLQGYETGRSVIHLENNLLYVPEAQGISHWYWKTVTPSNSIEVIFDLPLIQPGQIDMSLYLWSGTTNPNSPDHSLSISLNGHPIEEISWEGIESYQANITISNELFKENDNHLIIERPKFADSSNDLIFLDAIDLNYSRLLSALENQIEFFATEESHLITGLDGTSIKL